MLNEINVARWRVLFRVGVAVSLDRAETIESASVRYARDVGNLREATG